jgi:hypothetical protein
MGYSQETLQERARLYVEAGIRSRGHKTMEDLEEERCAGLHWLPSSVEELPPWGLSLVLAKGQRWRKEFLDFQKHFSVLDGPNVKYLCFLWCSITRTLTLFDSRNFEGGVYAYGEYYDRDKRPPDLD